MTCANPAETTDSLGRLYDDPEERVAALEGLRSAGSTVEQQRSVFGALASEPRLELLGALRDGEKCACELQVVLDAPQSTVASHLRTLRDAGLVRRRRKGKWSYYRIADGAVLDLLDLAVAMGEGDATADQPEAEE